MPVRLLAIDLDGTLVNQQLRIDPRDVAAVQAAQKAGVEVVIATGRMFRSALPFAQQLGVGGPMINYQGATVREIGTGEVLYRCELSLAMQRRVLAYAEPRDWHVNVYVNEEVFTARARPEADLYARIAGVPYTAVGPLSEWIHAEATKMVLVVLDPAAVPGRMAELSQWMAGVGRVTRSLDWFIEVINPEVSKARALALIADRANVAQADVCAIGDNSNDAEMVAWAGVGVAMGGAPDGLKRVAKHVTGTIEEAGVAQAIDRFVLNGALPSGG